MSSFSQTYTGNSSVTIPAFAESIVVTAVGARGGNGGQDSNPGGGGGNGRAGTFNVPTSSSSRTLTFNIGRRGTDGFGCVSNSGVGPGGAGVARGGDGGRTGPQGCSGGGGGGGGATGVYDSLSNSWVIVAGGGGGGGGGSHPDSFLRGGDGVSGLGWNTGNVNNISNGGTGASQSFDGGGGGGGGGGCPGGAGGREGADDRAGRYPSLGGGGGASGYNSSRVTWTGNSFLNGGEGYVSVSYIIPPPNVTFSVSPTSIIRGESATLSWNVTGNVSSVSINQGIGNVSTSGTRSVSPSSTTIYTITATGAGGTTTQNVTLTVYVPPNVTFSLDSPTIIRGQCTTLRWTTTGDATSATINQGIGSVNINGNRQVCPTETLTYTINVSGLGGSDSDSITLTVYQPPTVNLTGPVSLNYNQQGTLEYQATNTDISLRVTPTYNYRGSSVTGTVVNLPTGASVGGQLTTQIPYNNIGPFSVTYTIVATGNGGQETKQIVIPINIDETPDNFLVPESEDLFKEQAPIFTPDAIATSYKIVIDDIDIPVEVKADKPILIDKNEQQNWKRLRRI